MNVALLAPFPIATLPGVDSCALSSDNVTVAPPAEALSKSTVQLALCPLFRLLGAHVSEDSTAGEIRLTLVVRDTPPATAVTVAVCPTVTSAPVAVKAAVVCPAITVTLAGTLRLALLLDKLTPNPPAGAAAVRVTLQERLPGV